MHVEPGSTTEIASETPAARVIRLFGAAKASAIAGLTTDAIRKWDRPLSQGGGGGLIPARHQWSYLAAASELGVALSAADLVAPVKEAEPVQ